MSKKSGALGDPVAGITRGGKGIEEKLKRAGIILFVLVVILLAVAIRYSESPERKLLDLVEKEVEMKPQPVQPAGQQKPAEQPSPVKPVEPDAAEKLAQIEKQIAVLRQKIQDQKEYITSLEKSTVSESGKRSFLMLQSAANEAIQEYESRLKELEIEKIMLQSEP